MSEQREAGGVVMLDEEALLERLRTQNVAITRKTYVNMRSAKGHSSRRTAPIAPGSLSGISEHRRRLPSSTRFSISWMRVRTPSISSVVSPICRRPGSWRMPCVGSMGAVGRTDLNTPFLSARSSTSVARWSRSVRSTSRSSSTTDLADRWYAELVPVHDEEVVDETAEADAVVDGEDAAVGRVVGGEDVSRPPVAVTDQVRQHVEVREVIRIRIVAGEAGRGRGPVPAPSRSAARARSRRARTSCRRPGALHRERYAGSARSVRSGPQWSARRSRAARGTTAGSRRRRLPSAGCCSSCRGRPRPRAST